MIAFLLGSVLGGFYFGGLYLSVRKMTEVKYPGLLMVISLAIRMGVLLIVFFYISKGGYKDILLALLGVILVRFAITFALKESKENQIKRGD